MAVIGKIRSKSGLLVGFVAGALIIFVLSDLLGGRGKGGNTRPDERIAGEVFGNEINYMEYQLEVDNAVENKKNEIFNQKSQQVKQQIYFEMMMKGQASGKQPSKQEIEAKVQEAFAKIKSEIVITDEEKDNIAEQTWNQLVNRKMFDKEIAEVGINVSSGELNDMLFGKNIQKFLSEAEMFKNPQGQFSVDSVKSLRQRVEGSAEGKAWWVETFEKPMKYQRQIDKYFLLISKGIYVTNAEVMADHVANNRKYKIKFVATNFAEVPDSTISVKDEDIKAYYEKNKHRKVYEQFGTRKFSWVEFPMVLSQQDYDDAKKSADDIKEKFTKASDDSLFVMSYSNTKQYSNDYDQPGKYPIFVDSMIQRADSGSVVGPYQEGDSYKMVKIRESKYEDQARVRHILIGSKGEGKRNPDAKYDIATAKKLADSIVVALKSKKANFESLLLKYNDDKGSNANGGVYDWFNKQVNFVAPFRDFAFAGKVGDIKSVETEFGFHVMEILGQRNQKVIKSALVDVKVVPLRETEMAAREKAVNFRTKISDATKFDEVAQGMKLNVQTKEIAYNQQNLDRSPGGRAFVSKVNSLNKNDIPDPFIFNDRYVVVKLDAIKKQGIPEFEDVKEIMKVEVIREKKAEMDAKKMKGVKSLEELANRLKRKVQEAEVTFGNGNIAGTSGTEYNVVGSICAMKKAGDMSVPLKGKSGVFVVVLQGITEAPELKDMTQTKMNLTNGVRSRSQNESYMALRQLAKVLDKRFEY